MHFSRLLSAKHITKRPQFLRSSENGIQTHPPYDVFINHRGVDTKRNITGLLHQYLFMHGFRPFLDCQSMNPGVKLLQNIEEAVHGCRVGIAVFSPRYCESWSCLHELALLLEARKRVIPIFYDIKPSQLKVVMDNNDNNHHYPASDALRFQVAVEEAADTVGIAFDSSTGDLSKLLENALDAVHKIHWE